MATGTFLADSASVDQTLDFDDAEDPHDLSFSSNHVLRASMVDNLVMSLDQFSGAAFEDPPYTPRHMPDLGGRTRRRGHTFSSSLSSEPDLQDYRAMPPVPETVPRIPVRSGMRHQKNLQKLPSIFGEDEDSVRTKVYDSQRAAQPSHHARARKNTSASGKSTASSPSSSIDLGHLASLSGRLGGPGNRRSRSFDFGTRPRPHPAAKQAFHTDGAPTPVIFAGPEAQNGGPVPIGLPLSPLARKNSAKSSKSAHVKKSRPPGLVSPTPPRPQLDPGPHVSSMKSAPSLGHAAAFEQKTPAASLHEPGSLPRPGFFRRVFGSARTGAGDASPHAHSHTPNTLTKSHLGRSTPVPDEVLRSSDAAATTTRGPKAVRRTSTDTAANKENQPVVMKKPSTFFRRRKKSMSHNVPAPLPLTLGAELKAGGHDAGGAPSPVSSLRAFMDPYLADSPVRAKGHARTNSAQGLHTPTPHHPPQPHPLPKDGSGWSRGPAHSRNLSHGSSKTVKSSARHVTSLRIPHQDSFLADSSSAEEPPRRSPFDAAAAPAETDRVDDAAPHAGHDLNQTPPSAASTLTSPTLDPRSATRRHGSWRSDRASQPSSSPVAEDAPAGEVRTIHPARAGRVEADKAAQVTPKASSRASPFASNSDISDYRSAPSTPLVVEACDVDMVNLTSPNILHVGQFDMPLRDADKIKAQQIFDHVDDEVDSAVVGGWLGEAGTERERVRKAYMALFDWSDQTVLDALRGLCERIALKGETQQMDRVLDAFSQRWCECNPSHALKSDDVVHAISYSILLLNTDLHLADIGQKMTRAQFVRNTIPTIKRVAQASVRDATIRGPRGHAASHGDPAVDPHAQQGPEGEGAAASEAPADAGLGKSWEAQVEASLKAFYMSIAQEPLPLFGAAPTEPAAGGLAPANHLLSIGSSMLRRTPSVLSKAQSETTRGRMMSDTRSLGARWITKARSRPRLPSAAGFGSSRTSIDEQSSTWSPSISSTWSRASLGKTLTSMSVDSFATEATQPDYQSSIGFANALSQAIIRDDQQMELPIEEGLKACSLLEDESLELCGAPWAKEGSLKHKCHLEGVDRRSKDRNWNDCFAVIEKGSMRLFSFSAAAKSLRHRARAPKAGAVVGGGNWQENAEEMWKFTLRHTIASALPPPGYSKARPYVWALSLPTGAVHLFSAGTPDIVKEFVSTANYWSARLSKEPMMGGISSMEYGWSDSVINRALVPPSEPALGANGTVSPRPSTQLSMRSSIDHVAGAARSRLAGDRVHISEWAPSQQSMFASQLMEVDQLKALQTYVSNVEEELQKHNELRAAMLIAFSAKSVNSTKAMNNWEKKSSHLLREIVKFRTYIATLQEAQGVKRRIYKQRQEESEALPADGDREGEAGGM